MQRTTFVALVLALLVGHSAVVDGSVNVSPVETRERAVQQEARQRVLSGVTLSQNDELVPDVAVIVRSASGEQQTTSDATGAFRLVVPPGPLTLKFEGKNIAPIEQTIGPSDSTENLQIKVHTSSRRLTKAS